MKSWSYCCLILPKCWDPVVLSPDLEVPTDHHMIPAIQVICKSKESLLKLSSNAPTSPTQWMGVDRPYLVKLCHFYHSYSRVGSFQLISDWLTFENFSLEKNLWHSHDFSLLWAIVVNFNNLLKTSVIRTWMVVTKSVVAVVRKHMAVSRVSWFLNYAVVFIVPEFSLRTSLT